MNNNYKKRDYVMFKSVEKIVYNYRLVCFFAFLLLSSFKLNADSYIYSFDTSFSGTALTGNAPWMTATFTDSGINQVLLNISTAPYNGGSGLLGTESVDKVFFNFNPAGNVNSLVFSPLSPAGLSVDTGVNAYKADGVGGDFDIRLNYPSNSFFGNQSFNYTISSVNPLNASMFAYAAPDGSGPGAPFYAAAHVLSAQSQSGQSDWIGSGAPVQAPEPATYAIMAGLIGMIAFMKISRAKKKAKI